MTGKFQRLFITGVILLGFSSEAISKVIEKSSDHLLVQNSGGKVIYQDITRVDGKEFRSVNWAKTEDAEARYLAKKINEVRVKHAPTGAMSSARVPTAIVGSVSRKTVLKNLLAKAVAGGRLAAGIGSGPVGWALTAATAYDLVAPKLKEHGYVWDSNLKNFVTDKEYIIEITPNDGRKDSKGEPIVLYRMGLTKRSYDYGYESYKSTLDALCDKASKDVDDYAESQGDTSHKSKEFKGSSSDHSCNVVTYWGASVKAFWRIKPNTKQAISQSEFDDIIGPVADNNPTPYVNATAKDDGTVPGVTVSPNVTVPHGTVLTIGPYTDSDGKAKQITVRFSTANGETTVNVDITPRPDLSPNSPSAPSASPNTGGQTSPQAGGQTSGQTGNEASSKTDGEPDKKEEDKPKDGSFLCDLFPDILACDKQPEAEEEPDLSIPEKVVNVDFQPASVFSETAECPAPVEFTIDIMGSSQAFAFSYEKPCMVAERLRYLLIAMAWVVAGFFCIRTISREV